MIEMKDELYAAPAYERQDVPFTANRHKWLLKWYRVGEGGGFFFSFRSPRNRRYSFWAERGRVTGAGVGCANGKMIASYWECWGDKPDRMDAVLRLTPKHIIDRLSLLLDAIG